MFCYSFYSKKMVMVKKFLLAMMAIMILLSGCENKSQYSIDYDMDTVLNHQKIIFIVSVCDYDEQYIYNDRYGYFIDQTGRKHIFDVHELYNHTSFVPIEQKYAYLLEHYEEFEAKDFLDDSKLRECIDYLYHVNPDAEIRTEGEVVVSEAAEREPTLYGVRMVNNHEEFVWLGTNVGSYFSQRLDDPSADFIFEEFGSQWDSLE